MSTNGPNTASGTGGYNWHDGHGNVHTRRQKVRRPGKGGGGGQNRPAPQPQGPAPLDQLLTPQQAMQLAQQQGDLQYGGAINDVQRRQAAVQPWFDNYVKQVQGVQASTAQMQQPAIDQATQAVQNQHATAGVDPNSQAGKDDALAAAGRAALMQLGVSSLQGIQGAGSAYFGAQQTNAPLYAQAASQQLGNQYGQLVQDRGNAVNTAYGNIRQGERQYGIDRQHGAVEAAAFGVNSANYAADNARADQQLNLDRQRVRQQGQPSALDLARYDTNRNGRLDPGEAVNAGSNGGLTPAQRRSLRQKSDKVVQRIKDLPGEFDRYSRQTNTDPATGKTSRPTRDDVISQLRKDGYNPAEIRLALKVRDGKPLSSNDIATAKRLGIRTIPKAWKQGAHPTYPTGGSMTTGAGGYPYGPGAGGVH